jgi:predicted DNA-binding transcriptional regulator YafY
MFTPEELEALVLGGRWVEARPDEPLARAAKTALAKIAAASPEDLRDRIGNTGLWPMRGDQPPQDEPLLAVVREAMRSERALHIAYVDENGAATERPIWPLALAYYEEKHVVVAWCTLRRDFRHFRVDRVRSALPTEERFGRRRAVLVKEWQAAWLAPRRRRDGE